MHILALILLFLYGISSYKKRQKEYERQKLLAEQQAAQALIAKQEAIQIDRNKFKRDTVPFDPGDPTTFDEYRGQEKAKALLTLTLGALVENKVPKILFEAPKGCVDASTEFLSPTGWKRIDEYKGEKVFQCHPDGSGEFVTPLSYVVEDCDKAFEFKDGRGTFHQVLSPEHRIVVHSKDLETWKELTAQELADFWRTNPKNWGKFYFPNSVKGIISNKGLDLSDAELRLQVAIIADGTFQTTNRVSVNIKKDRKKERLRRLLEELGLEYKASELANGYTRFYFYAPRVDKEFTSYYWTATKEQLDIIADELPHWNGSFSSRNNGSFSFSSYSKISADFAHYVYVVTGHTASISAHERTRRDKKEIEYEVAVRGKQIDYCPKGCAEQVKEIVPEGNKVYCFQVPSSFLLLRKNGRPFVTGNCGKTCLGRVFSREFLDSWEKACVEAGYPKRGKYIETMPSMFASKKELDVLMGSIEPFDVLLMDEIHMFDRKLADTLLPALEDNLYPFDDGLRRLPEIWCCIGATTDVGLLPDAFQDRWQIIQLNPLTCKELVDILHMQPFDIDNDAATIIAQRSAGYPRDLKKVFARARDVAVNHSSKIITLNDAITAFNLLELDEQGLYRVEREILKVLWTRPKKYAPRANGTVPLRYAQSESTLRTILGLDEHRYKQMESKLMRMNFLTIGTGGRELTDLAIQTYFKDQTRPA